MLLLGDEMKVVCIPDRLSRVDIDDDVDCVVT